MGPSKIAKENLTFELEDVKNLLMQGIHDIISEAIVVIVEIKNN